MLVQQIFEISIDFIIGFINFLTHDAITSVINKNMLTLKINSDLILHAICQYHISNKFFVIYRFHME